MIPIIPATAGEEHNLFLPPAYDMLWSVVIVLPIFIVFLVYAMPKINAILDQRAETIEDGLEAAARAQEQEALAKRRSNEIIAEAHAKAGAIRSEASDDARAIRAEAQAKAEEEAERIIEGAQRQILAERQAAEISLKSDVGILATELAEKIVGEHLRDRDLTARIVDRFLDDLDSQVETKGV